MADPEPSASSCPVVGRTDAAGTPLHPLTNMPLAIYDQQADSAQAPTPAPAPAAPAPAPKQPWRPWHLIGLGRPKAHAAAPAAAPAAAEAGAAPTGVPGEPQLSKDRQKSSIPIAAPQLPAHQKGAAEAEGVWMYPSESMFYSAMKRKGWEPAAQDMPTVVAIHNSVNERAWGEVMAWEQRYAGTCAEPRLKKFQGKPSELSPKARVLNWMGVAPPFDRHDWVVDRCGQEVRYIIDFYSAPAPPGRPPAMFLDARPALDSFQAAADRLAMQFKWVTSARWMTDVAVTQGMPPTRPPTQAQPAEAGAAAEGGK